MIHTCAMDFTIYKTFATSPDFSKQWPCRRDREPQSTVPGSFVSWGWSRTSTLPETQRAVCAGMLNHVRLCNPRDCSPPGSSVYGISWARILEQVAISFSRGSSRPGDLTPISCIGRWVLYHWATWRLFTGWPRVLTHILCSSAWPGNSLPLRSSRLWDRPEQAYQHQQWEAQGRLSPDGMGWVWQGVPPWGRREKAAVSGEGWQDEGRTQL